MHVQLHFINNTLPTIPLEHRHLMRKPGEHAISLAPEWSSGGTRGISREFSDWGFWDLHNLWRISKWPPSSAAASQVNSFQGHGGFLDLNHWTIAIQMTSFSCSSTSKGMEGFEISAIEQYSNDLLQQQLYKYIYPKGMEGSEISTIEEYPNDLLL